MNGTAPENHTETNDNNGLEHEFDNSTESKATDKTNDSNTTKKIILYRNGDKYFPPKTFVVNKRYIRTWDSFLEELTKSIQPRNGAIRDIRTPFHGSRIRSLDDLTLNGKYVAVSTGEAMKLIDYTGVTNLPRQNKKNIRQLRPIKKINHDMEKIESKIYQQLYTKGIVIYVYRNGDPFTRKIKIILNQFEQKHMSVLVRAIEDRVLLPSNRPIRRLYTMEGEKIRYAKDVENGQDYVVAANEPFQNIKYGQLLPVIRGGRVPSGRLRMKFLNTSPTPVTDRLHSEANANDATYRSQKSVYTDRDKHYPLTGRNLKKLDKEREKRDTAALTIQAAFRGFITRKEINMALENNSHVPQTRYRYEPNTSNYRNKKDQLTNRQKQNINEHLTERKETTHKPKDQYSSENRNKPKPLLTTKDTTKSKKATSNERQHAAMVIQAGFRGYQVRKKMSRFRRNLPKDKVISNRKNSVTKEKEEEKPNNNQVKEEQAATTIQASFRGYKTRKELETRDVKVQRELAAIKIQAGFRGYKTRETLKKRETAANNIQAGYRGFKARDTSKKTRTKTQDEMSAITIQAGFRGYKVRDGLRKRETAATKIQAGFRAHCTRQSLKEREESRRKNEAALKIQSAYNGYKTRKLLQDANMIDNKERAAREIQAGYRGFQTRKTINGDLNARLQEKTAEQQAEERNRAALSIQAGFSGYKARLDRKK